MNNNSTRKRRVQKTLGLHYSRFYLIARCIDSLFRRKILENRSSAAPVEKVGLKHLDHRKPIPKLCRQIVDEFCRAAAGNAHRRTVKIWPKPQCCQVPIIAPRAREFQE